MEPHSRNPSTNDERVIVVDMCLLGCVSCNQEFVGRSIVCADVVGLRTSSHGIARINRERPLVIIVPVASGIDDRLNSLGRIDFVKPRIEQLGDRFQCFCRVRPSGGQRQLGALSSTER